MRHVYMRGILALVWAAVAVVNGVSGNLATAAFFLLIGALLAGSAFGMWKKEKRGEEER